LSNPWWQERRWAEEAGALVVKEGVGGRCGLDGAWVWSAVGMDCFGESKAALAVAAPSGIAATAATTVGDGGGGEGGGGEGGGGDGGAAVTLPSGIAATTATVRELLLPAAGLLVRWAEAEIEVELASVEVGGSAVVIRRTFDLASGECFSSRG